MITLFRPDTIYALEQVKEIMAEHIRQLPGHITPIGTSLNIIRYELPIDPISILYWLHNQKADTKIYWSDKAGESEVGGIGITDKIKGEGAIDHKEIFSYMENHLSEDNPHLRYYGGLSFDPTCHDREWEKFGTYQFIVPQFELFMSDGQTLFAFNIAIDDINNEKTEKAIQMLDKIDFSPETTYRKPPKVLKRKDFPDSDQWAKTFSAVDQDISNKEYEKVVLARRSIFDFDVELRPNALMKHLKDQTPGCFYFCFQPCADTAFLGATPERLYKRRGLKIQSEAIAGTRPRGKDDTDDTALENQLMSSSKDAHEHQYVVKMIQSALELLCHKIRSDKKFSLKKLGGTQHLQTSFEGDLIGGISDDQILPALHPTPAVGGHPTEKAIKTIRETEPFNRGWYAGPVGYIGYDQAEFAVAIRSGLIHQDHLSLYAGAGIVSGSTLKNEWNEIENKISTFIKVFNK